MPCLPQPPDGDGGARLRLGSLDERAGCVLRGALRFALSVLLVLSPGSGCAATSGVNRRAPTTGLVIAHRGASAYEPQHTLQAYELALTQGADWIEPDLVLTRDGVLVCLHDLTLEGRSDVAERFPDRAREDGHWYVIDFDLADLKTLRVASGPDDRGVPYRIASFEELLTLLAKHSREKGRTVGVFAEPKNPAFHRREGQPLEGPVLLMLEQFGYRTREDAALVQCFDSASLQLMREGLHCRLRLVFLTSEALDEARLDELGAFVDGIAASAALIEDGSLDPGDLRARGLAVYAWTFDDDEARMRRFYEEFGVDGVITNNPDVGVRAAHLSGIGKLD
jgi:glycerophosphoryl diester phosphodiesterase